MKAYCYTFLSIFITASCVFAADAPNARISLHVMTPDGIPVSAVRVGIGGGLNTPDGEFPRKANGETDKFGGFAATIESSRGMISFFAEAPGFYATEATGIMLYKNGNEVIEAQKRGRWQPWERTIKVILKPIKNPVPMYAKRLEVLVPEVGKPVGYDLEKGDWVAPYGKGIRTDFEFTVEGHYESKLNYAGKLTLCLPGEGNGIQAYDLDPVQRSEFKSPYEAPEAGYKSDWIWHNSRKTPMAGQPSVFVDESNTQREFTFRVRTVFNAQGQVMRANYGKIYGPVYFQTFEHGKSRVGFIYYYNPDETRNLEFDPKHNLFPKEHVGEP